MRLVYPEDGEPPDEHAARAHAAELEATGYSIHFHVWTQPDLLELMLHCQERLEAFEIEAVRRVGLENIVVLRKHGELVIETTQADGDMAPEPEHRPSARLSSSPSAKLPLSALRVTLDEGSAQTHWSVDPDGLTGRAIVQSAGSVVTIPLRLAGPVGFSAQVRLLPHDWRDGAGVLRTWVAVTGRRGVSSARFGQAHSQPPCCTRATRTA